MGGRTEPMKWIGNFKRTLKRAKELAGRILDYSPALEDVAEDWRQRQDVHWEKVRQTPFAPASLRIYSPGRGRYPQPGEFADATGTLRDRLRRGITVDKRWRQVRRNPYTFGDSHPTAASFRELAEYQESLQRAKGAGSLYFPITQEVKQKSRDTVIRYIKGDFGK